MKPINTSIFDFPTLIQRGFVYVDKTALKQCRERNYAARFVGENRPVYYVGVNYNPAADVRTVDDVKCERADQTDLRVVGLSDWDCRQQPKHGGTCVVGG